MLREPGGEEGGRGTNPEDSEDFSEKAASQLGLAKQTKAPICGLVLALK